MEHKIQINESFFEDETPLSEKLKKGKFDSTDIFELKMDAGEVSKETEINELISYDLLKKNLEYKLPHQPEGALKILRDFNGTALLADEVGLGKTITTGIILKECILRGFVKKALILTPPSLVDQWVSELKEKFELDFKIIETESDWNNTKFAIASIDRVKIFDKEKRDFRHSDAHKIPWDILIVDEAHKLKQRSTIRWKFVDRMQKKRFLVLTATPFQNDLLELYNLLHLLKKGHLGTVKEFRKKFLNRGNKRYPLNPKDLKNKLDEVMVRRRRDQTGIIYKKRIAKIIPVHLSDEEYEIYKGINNLLKEEYFSRDGNEINGKLIIYAILPKITSSSRSAMESLLRIAEDEKYHQRTRDLAFQIYNACKNLKRDSKIEKLVEIIREIMKEDPKNKILIYTKHPTTLNYIIEKLQPFNFNIVPFIGGLDREEKTRRIKEFKESADIMISTETGSEGLNFQFCSNLINYDLPWNPMSVEQRIGRLDRIGQKKDMNIFSLATKNTMEEHIVDLIINKMCCVGLVIGELPIILFNLGLDGEGNHGGNKIEERLMNLFIDSKNNLDIFSKEIHKIGEIIDKGIEEYKKNTSFNKEVLDNVNRN